MRTGHLINRDISDGNGSIISPMPLQNYDNGGGGGGSGDVKNIQGHRLFDSGQKGNFHSKHRFRTGSIIKTRCLP